MEVNYLTRNEINTLQWDECVSKSKKPLIYALSWYLDAATQQQWDAFVIGEYESVLPLPFNRKLVKKQVYMPRAVKQLGWFGRHIDYEIESLLDEHFIQYEYAISTTISTSAETKFLNEIDLNKPYAQLLNNYRSDRKKDIQQAEQFELLEISITDYMEAYQTHASSIIKQQNVPVKQFERVYKAAKQNNAYNALVAYKKNEFHSAIACVQSFNRIHVLSSSTANIGYKSRAFSVLVNHIIKQFSNQNYVLDFMGSSVKGIQAYNESFGASTIPYSVFKKENQIIQKVKQIIRND